jgi:hypothetical protein
VLQAAKTHLDFLISCSVLTPFGRSSGLPGFILHRDQRVLFLSWPFSGL